MTYLLQQCCRRRVYHSKGCWDRHSVQSPTQEPASDPWDHPLTSEAFRHPGEHHPSGAYRPAFHPSEACRHPEEDPGDAGPERLEAHLRDVGREHPEEDADQEHLEDEVRSEHRPSEAFRQAWRQSDPDADLRSADSCWGRWQRSGSLAKQPH